MEKENYNLNSLPVYYLCSGDFSLPFRSSLKKKNITNVICAVKIFLMFLASLTVRSIFY